MQYSKLEYWQHRYTQENDSNYYFDWLQQYESPTNGSPIVGVFVDEIEDAEANILIIGVGTSRLAEDMYNDGWLNITAIDFCKPAIDLQLKLNQEAGTKVKYRLCDAKNM